MNVETIETRFLSAINALPYSTIPGTATVFDQYIKDIGSFIEIIFPQAITP